ncbi:hypothetical protein GGR20_001367 [Devosia subaequoris]|uniref:Uncharacterized protein n=1 Tax=Devosia subaequoris TaxID=395930 RepID=A0A7W6NBJ1_9HYPH|nr:hypothetical protein [Devosia subaequoris]
MPHRHRHGAARHRIQAFEPTFAVLLLATGRIQLDIDIGRFRLEVGWRIVEGQVTVFADTGEADINWALRNKRRDAR